MKFFSAFYREILDENICDDEKIPGLEDVQNLGNIKKNKRILIE